MAPICILWELLWRKIIINLIIFTIISFPYIHKHHWKECGEVSWLHTRKHPFRLKNCKLARTHNDRIARLFFLLMPLSNKQEHNTLLLFLFDSTTSSSMRNSRLTWKCIDEDCQILTTNTSYGFNKNTIHIRNTSPNIIKFLYL